MVPDVHVNQYREVEFPNRCIPAQSIRIYLRPPIDSVTAKCAGAEFQRQEDKAHLGLYMHQ